MNQVDSFLLKSAQEGNLEGVKQAIEEGANVNAKRSFETALHYAAMKGYVDIIKYLIQKGANINYKGRIILI